MMREQENAVAIESLAIPTASVGEESQESLRLKSPTKQANATDRLSFDATPAMARKAVSARPPLPYQTAMQSGDWAMAWQQLEYTEGNQHKVLDHDLLSQLRGDHDTPRCQQQPDLNGADQLLCDALAARAAGHPLPPGHRQALEESEVTKGSYAYRLSAIHALFK